MIVLKYYKLSFFLSLGTRKEANEDMFKMGWSVGSVVPMSLLVARPEVDLASGANKRKERGENERQSGHAVGTSLGGDRDGPWSVNPSPQRRARTDPPKGYEDAVNEREKVRGKEREKEESFHS